MLMRAPPPNPSHKVTKLFVSVPRRIAAKALVERLRAVEPDLKDQIALRMGHGVREYETSNTRAWFVTSGYLVRLMANHPERFDSVSIVIIDEVHERSVDTGEPVEYSLGILVSPFVSSISLSLPCPQCRYPVPFMPSSLGDQSAPSSRAHVCDSGGRSLPGLLWGTRATHQGGSPAISCQGSLP